MSNNSLVKIYRPTSAGIRWKTSSKIPKISKNYTSKQLSFNVFTKNKKSIKKKNISSGKSTRKYKKIKIPIRVNIKSNECFFFKLVRDNHSSSKKYYLCETSKNEKFWVSGGFGSYVGKVVLNFGDRRFAGSYIGLPVLLRVLPYFVKISNISDKFCKKLQYTLSSGSKSVKQKAGKKEKLIKIILTSTSIKYVNNNTLAMYGPASQMWKNKVVSGKAGVNSNRGRKSSVRGIAKNPVDHPHGGKSNSKSPEVSPWGWITKKNH